MSGREILTRLSIQRGPEAKCPHGREIWPRSLKSDNTQTEVKFIHVSRDKKSRQIHPPPPQCFQDVLRSYLHQCDSVEKQKNPEQSFTFSERDDVAAESDVWTRFFSFSFSLLLDHDRSATWWPAHPTSRDRPQQTTDREKRRRRDFRTLNPTTNVIRQDSKSTEQSRASYGMFVKYISLPPSTTPDGNIHPSPSFSRVPHKAHRLKPSRQCVLLSGPRELERFMIILKLKFMPY